MLKLILTCEHGGSHIPLEYKKYFRGNLRILKTHRALDIGALAIAEDLKNYLSVSLDACTVSRLIVDTNETISKAQFFSKKILFALFILFSFSESFANIVGTDVQNFNPTTSGLDFVTVQSSETLQPGLMNFGLYFNYAGNTLAYTRNVSNQVLGDKPGDRILGMDLNLGLGLSDNWDIGLSLPAVLSQELSETMGVAKYNSQGFTDVRANTKYRFWGNASQGIAAVFSVSKSLISNNPFTGQDAGPTFNYELVADTTVAEKFGVGVNIGYRQPRVANLCWIKLCLWTILDKKGTVRG